MKECFECEATQDLHEHHVVPKSRGGTKTVTLCHQCHMKAHGRDGKGLNHRKLTKEGMKTALEKRRLIDPNYKFGNPQIEIAQAKGRKAIQKRANRKAEEYITLLSSLYEQTGSYNATARELNNLGIKTQRNKIWRAQTVSNMLNRYKNNLGGTK